MQRFSDVIQNQNGRPKAGLRIVVDPYAPGASPNLTAISAATIYATDGGAAVQSVLTDADGRFSFYAADGRYNLTVTGAGVVPYMLADVTLNSPDDEPVDVIRFGAKGDGLTDDTAAWNRSILYLALRGGGRLLAPFATYKLAGKVLLPSNVEVDLCGSTLVGAGVGAGVMFETAYLSNGALVSNIGTANESHLIQKMRVHDGTIRNGGTAFNVFNFIWNCGIERIQFENVTRCVVAKRCWYSKFHQLISLFDAGGTSEPAFQFTEFVNVQNISSVFCTGRKLAYKFDGGINGLSLNNVSAENCTNGMVFEGEINPLNIDSCYFEGITGTAIDMTHASAKRAVTIDNNWFYAVGTAIAGTGMVGGRIGRGNYFLGCPVKVNIADNASFIHVEQQQQVTADNTSTVPAVTQGYTLGPNVAIERRAVVLGSNGRALVSTLSQTNVPVDLPYFGYTDFVPGKVPFCTVAPYAGGVDIDSEIFPSFVASGPIILRIVDGSGEKFVRGQFYGTTLDVVTTGGATATAYIHAGKLRFNVAGLTGTPSVVEGIIRLA